MGHARIRAAAAVAGLLAAPFLLGACSSSPPPDMTVHGVVELATQQFSEIQPGEVDYNASYYQVDQGNAQVTITDPSGKVLAVAPLDNGNVSQPPVPASGGLDINTGWTAKVPEGLSFYGVSVSGISGTIHFTEQQMKAGPAVCVGDACNGSGI